MLSGITTKCTLAEYANHGYLTCIFLIKCDAHCSDRNTLIHLSKRRFAQTRVCLQAHDTQFNHVKLVYSYNHTYETLRGSFLQSDYLPYLFFLKIITLRKCSPKRAARAA